MTKNFFGQNILFLTKTFSDQIFFWIRYFFQAKNLLPKFFFGQNSLSAQEIFLDQTLFWTKSFLDQIYIWTKHFLGQKLFWTKKKFGGKKISTNFFVTQIFLTQIYLPHEKNGGVKVTICFSTSSNQEFYFLLIFNLRPKTKTLRLKWSLTLKTSVLLPIYKVW